MNYAEFINSKKHSASESGFEPLWFPTARPLFDFQEHIADKAIRKGRMGVFIDTGLGKTAVALTIAQNIVLKTNKKVLILTPLAVAFQFLKEAAEIGINDIEHTKDGKHTKKIVLCNYERLHYLKSDDFECVICDESSVLKNYSGKIKNQITEFVKKVPYRFLLSATPAPNSFIEVGTSSEALGYMGYMDMLSTFFASVKDTQDSRDKNIGENYYLKPHAKNSFFEWINTWAVMLKTPSDLGFSDEGYILPKLITNNHWVKSEIYSDETGQMLLLPIIAKDMHEIRNEQKQTEKSRCEMAVQLANNKTSVYWCNTNGESELLDKMDKNAVEITGSQSIEQKEETLKAFVNCEIPRIITKSKITGFGLNMQHCCHTVYFPTFSFEQWYQSVRRFWRFGQKNEVTVDVVLSAGQERILQALNEKQEKALDLYEQLLKSINSNYKEKELKALVKMEMPTFIGATA